MKNLFIMLSVLCTTNMVAQPPTHIKSDYPVIGKRCPDFALNNIEHFGHKTATLKDFKGKWLILDLWQKNCFSCIASFPETNSLQQEFKNKVQFMLVGIASAAFIEPTRQVYERSRLHYNLMLPAAYDSSLAERFGVFSFPHVIWIDDKGIVRAITGSVNQKDLRQFLAGMSPDVGEKQNDEERMADPNRFDMRKPFLINGNGGNDTDFYMRSVFTGWQKEAVATGSAIESTEPLGFFKPNCILATNCPVSRLYETAYGDTVAWYSPWNPDYGKWWTNGPLLELNDRSAFLFNYDRGKNLYCYNLVVPAWKADKKKMQEIMQAELKNYFGFEVQVEKRMMPYWGLTATQEARILLHTKGGTPRKDGSKAAIILKNKPVSELIEIIWSVQQQEPFFVDETAISGNIDITLNCVFTDFTDLKRELQKNGLTLVKGKKEMNVIVIRDPKSDRAIRN